MGCQSLLSPAGNPKGSKQGSSKDRRMDFFQGVRTLTLVCSLLVTRLQTDSIFNHQKPLTNGPPFLRIFLSEIVDFQDYVRWKNRRCYSHPCLLSCFLKSPKQYSAPYARFQITILKKIIFTRLFFD
jgi:hypothetical protein